MKKSAATIDPEAQLQQDIAGFYADPYGYVMYNFPWGVPGTRLANEEGPEDWQVQELIELGERVMEAEKIIAEGGEASSIRTAIGSGHGVGKTAYVAWIVKWFMATRVDPQAIITANTETQLQRKTWRELSKWNQMALDGHWFEWTATTFKYRERPETWFAIAQTWSENNPDAFQGTHEDNVLLIFDEASGIPDPIWESAEGAMTTPRCIWLVFGNLTKPTGKFVDCFGRFAHRWRNKHIDSRTVRRSNKRQIEEWKEDYGEDSDFFRIRVKGEKPRSATAQFFGDDIVQAAIEMEVFPEEYKRAVRLAGFDVARHGDDRSVHTERRGRKQFNPIIFQGKDTMWLASWIAKTLEEARDEDDPFAAYFIDAIGIGWGVYDRLVQLNWGHIVIPVQVSEQATEPDRYFNKRAELYDKYRRWLKSGADIPDDERLKTDLAGPEYGFSGRDGKKLQIESKKDMKRRGLASPDVLESAILTFAEDVSDVMSDIPTVPIDTYPSGTWMGN